MKKFIQLSFLVIIFNFFIVTTSFAAKYEFSPSSGNLTQTCNYQATLMVDTEGVDSNAADIIINYNTSEIEIIDSNSSLPGKQIGTGDAYEFYVGNEVNESLGRIRLTGSSLVQNFNGRKVFANISFRSLPATTSTTFSIVYSGPGVTLDSNIAEASTSLDILNGVTNATFNFAPGDCFTDTSAPNISFLTPTNGATGVPLDSNVQVRITDGLSGVDISSVIITINGRNYTFNDSEFSYSGGPGNYLITINPSENFPADTASTIRVEATDLRGNNGIRFITFNVPVPPPVVTTPGPTGTPVVCPTGVAPSGTIPPVIVDTDDNEQIIIEKIVEKECTYNIETLRENIIESSGDNIIEKTVSNVVLNISTPPILGGLAISAYLIILLLGLDSSLSIFSALFFHNTRRSGQVISSINNNPISFARLMIKYQDGLEKTVRSDIDGFFFIDKTKLSATVTAKKSGFLENTQNVVLEEYTNPVIKITPDENVMRYLYIGLDGFLKLLIYISPYLMGIGFALSVIQGLLEKGTAFTIYSIAFFIIILVRVVGKLV